MIEKIKTLEHQGYQFEGADASLELLLREATGEMNETFTFESFKMLVEKNAEHPVVSEAFVKLKVGDENLYTAAEGNGPVNALDNALRKALQTYFPQLKEMHLSDYKVRVIDEQDQTAAKVRVLIESKNFTDTWSTVGVSSNVIEASWEALVDSMRYAILNQLTLDNEKSGNNEPRGLVNH